MSFQTFLDRTSNDFGTFFQRVKEYENSNKKSEEDPASFIRKTVLPILEFPEDKKILSLYENILYKIKSQIHKKNWKIQEKILLVWIIYYFLKIHNKQDINQFEKSDWQIIANYLNRSYIECVFKFNSLMISQQQNSQWTPTEDNLLSSIVCAHKKNSKKLKWIEIARELFEKSNSTSFRNEKMCREHWISVLDSSLNHSDWNLGEDATLLKNYLKYGPKWTKISEILKGRSVYALKNRFCSLITKYQIQKGEYFIQNIEMTLREMSYKNKKNHLNESTMFLSNSKCNSFEDVTQEISLDSEKNKIYDIRKNFIPIPVCLNNFFILNSNFNDPTSLYNFSKQMVNNNNEQFSSNESDICLSQYHNENAQSFIEKSIDKYFAF